MNLKQKEPVLGPLGAVFAIVGGIFVLLMIHPTLVHFRIIDASDRISVMELGKKVPVVVEIHPSARIRGGFSSELQALGGVPIPENRYNGTPTKRGVPWYKCLVRARGSNDSVVAWECGRDEESQVYQRGTNTPKEAAGEILRYSQWIGSHQTAKAEAIK